MKLFLITFFKFLAFATGFYILLLVVDGFFFPRIFGGNLFKYDTTGDYTATRLREADKLKNVDLLIIGSSHAYRGYDTKFFKDSANLNSFNLGTSAQTLRQSEIMLNKYIGTLKPKYAIIDVYPVLLNSDGVESTLELLSVGVLSPEMIEYAMQTEDARAYNSLLFYMIKDKVLRSNKKIKDLPVKGDQYFVGGYIRSTKAGYDETEHYTTSSIPYADKQIEALGRMVSVLKKNNVKYIIAQAPSPKDRYLSYDNNAKLDSMFSSYGPYFNFNKEAFLPNSFFMDQSHINEKGVAVYNRSVLQKMRETFSLK